MFDNLYLVFTVGFFSGIGFFSLLFFLRKEKKIEVKEDTDLISLKNHMQSIQQSLQNFNLAQDRIENTLIRGGALQQGPWGEFVLKNILDNVGLREGEEYSTQKSFRDEEGNLQKPDVVVHMPGNRHIIIDSKVSLESWHDYSNTNDSQQKNFTEFIDLNMQNFDFNCISSMRFSTNGYLLLLSGCDSTISIFNQYGRLIDTQPNTIDGMAISVKRNGAYFIANKKGLIKYGKDQPKNLFIESNLIDIDYHDKKFIVLTDSLLLQYDFFD